MAKPKIPSFLIILASTLIAVETHSDPQPVYADQIGDVVRLANEQSIPFQFLARTVSDENVARKYGASVSRFPSVQSCLIKTERGKIHPDLTMVDWSKIRSTQDADVCFFRVASSYNNIDTFRAWLEFHGFKVTARFERRNAEPMGAWIGLSGSRNHAENNGRLFNTGVFQKFLGQDHSMSVLGQFDHTDNVIGIQTTFNTK